MLGLALKGASKDFTFGMDIGGNEAFLAVKGDPSTDGERSLVIRAVFRFLGERGDFLGSEGELSLLFAADGVSSGSFCFSLSEGFFLGRGIDGSERDFPLVPACFSCVLIKLLFRFLGPAAPFHIGVTLFLLLFFFILFF